MAAEHPMSPEVMHRLVELNRLFYEQFGVDFAQSRERPQPGWERLLPYFPETRPLAVLDVGCGDGRFVRYLTARGVETRYTGVDFAGSLLDLAKAAGGGSYKSRELSAEGCLDGLGTFGLVVCLSTLQHIPGRANRARLLRAMGDHLAPGGLLVLANWQFLHSERQRRKICDWADAGFDPTEVEPGDYLLTWERGGHGLRYVGHVDEAATAELAELAGLRVLGQFRSDGREGDLNLYTILRS